MSQYPNRGNLGDELTPREVECLQYASDGCTSTEIGQKFDPVITRRTVEAHLLRAYNKLGARNRIEAINKAKDAGLIKKA